MPGRNVEALDVLLRLARDVAHAPARIVYLWGEPGSGRTHLLTALAAARNGVVWTAAAPPEQPGLECGAGGE